MTLDSPAPRRWWRPRLYSAILAIVLVYAAVVTLYALSGQVRVVQDGEATDTDTVLTLEPRSVNALTNEIEITTGIQSPQSVGNNGLAFDEDVTLVTIPARGEGQHAISKDQIIAPVTSHIEVDGAVEFWPFDRYSNDVVVIFPAHMVGDDLLPMPAYYDVKGEVPGWSIGIDISPAGEVAAAAGADAGAVEDPGFAIIHLTAQRSVATIAFAVVLLALMVVVPVLVLMIAISAYRGRRKVEATLMSWMGAMLFATIPLRNFFPGSPPIGSWVDYLVVLWVIAGLIAGLAIFAAAWMRWTPRPDVPPRF